MSNMEYYIRVFAFIIHLAISQGYLFFDVHIASADSSDFEKFACNAAMTIDIGMDLIKLKQNLTSESTVYNTCYCLMYPKDNQWPAGGYVLFESAYAGTGPPPNENQIQQRLEITMEDFMAFGDNAVKFNYYLATSANGSKNTHWLEIQTSKGENKFSMTDHKLFFDVARLPVGITCDPHDYVDSIGDSNPALNDTGSSTLHTTPANTESPQTTTKPVAKPITEATSERDNAVIPTTEAPRPGPNHGQSSNNGDTIVQAVVIPIVIIAVICVFVILCFVRKRRIRASRVRNVNDVGPRAQANKVNGCCIKVDLSSSMEEFGNDVRLNSGSSGLSTESHYTHVNNNNKLQTGILNNINSAKIINKSLTEPVTLNYENIRNGISIKAESNKEPRDETRAEFKLI